MSKEPKFWMFEESEKLTLKEEDLANYKLKNKFYDDVSHIFLSILKCGIHPCLKCPSHMSLNSQPTTINFYHCLVDINSLKILFFMLPNSKVTTLKFTTNWLLYDHLEFLINSLLTKPHNIYNFSYDWNDKITYEDQMQYSFQFMNTINDEKLLNVMNKSKELLLSLVTTPCQLEYLCLRGNFLGDKTVIQMFEALKENNNLIVLNLYKNNITNECSASFVEMLLNNKKLEEINLGANLLEDEFITNIVGKIGKFKLSPEELEEYNKRAKERQEIIKNNEKLRKAKKPEVEVPTLEELTVIDNENYIVYNDVMQTINFIENKFTDSIYDSVCEILKGDEKLKVSFDMKSFTLKQRTTLLDEEGPYAGRVYLLK